MAGFDIYAYEVVLNGKSSWHSESKKALKEIHAFSCILIELFVYVTSNLFDGEISGVGIGLQSDRSSRRFMNLERHR